MDNSMVVRILIGRTRRKPIKNIKKSTGGTL